MKLKSKKQIKERERRNPVAVVTVGRVKVYIYEKRRKGLNRKGCDKSGRKRKPVTYQFLDSNSRQREAPDLATAKSEAERIANAIATGQVEAALMTDSQAQSYGRALVILKPTGDTLETACERYAKCVEILGMGSKIEEACKAFVERDRLPVKFVDEVVKEMLTEKEGKREERTIRDLKNRLDKFAKDFHCPISSITTSDVQGWLDGRNTGERNIINYRNKLSVLFNWAWRRNYVLANPVEMTERPEDKGGEIEIYTPVELSRLIAAAQEKVKNFFPCLVIGAFAGLRSSEIQRLTWEHVNQQRGHIIASAKKRGTPSRRLVPIQPNLAAWLADYSSRKGKVWRGDEEEFFGAQYETASATAVEANPEKGIAAQEAVKWKHNGLRHSFVSYRLAMLQNDAQVAIEAGNSPGTIHAHYKELVTPNEATAWFAIAPESPANVISIAKAAPTS
jgi:integrase